MRALLVKNQKLIFANLSDPVPSAEEILVKVDACGVNHADLLQKVGKYPPPPGVSEILGLEVAGTVEEVGINATRYKKNDKVMCLLSGGGYAEKVCIHEALAMPIPKNLNAEEASGIPEVFLTAYQALFQIGELRPNQWVLVHAAGSGVGTAALQLIRAAGAKSIATTRSKNKLEKCLELGANAVINTTDQKFAKKVQEITEGHGADLLLDFIGAPYFEENMEALAIGGALIFLATLGGNIKEKFNIRLLMQKWATLSGTTLRPRPLEYKAKLVEEFSRFALSRFESKELKPTLYTSLSWEEAEKAHDILEQNLAFGKITLKIK